MAINPANFVKRIDNPYLPLTPGKTFVYDGVTEDGEHFVGHFNVTHNTKVVAGVTCVEILDVETIDGEVVEKTRDWFAQDKDGNVWYFGELSKEYENGKVVSTAGSWEAGVDGAEPGIVMLANPEPGDKYQQELAPGIAEDRAEVLSDTLTQTFPYGTFSNVVQTHETSPLDPELQDHKFYAPGIGQLHTLELLTGVTETLIKIRIEGGAGKDTLMGMAGTQVLVGKAGRDLLDGDSGNDTLKGGRGADNFLFNSLANGLQEVDLIADYNNKDKIDLPDGATSVIGDALVDGGWQLVLAGDGDVIKLSGVTDTNGNGHILDDLLIV